MSSVFASARLLKGEALRSPEEIIADMLARDVETAQILEGIRGML